MSRSAPLRTSYLDYNATAPVKPAVVEAMVGVLGASGNASSVHRAGRAARRALEQAREAVAALVGAAPGAVVFTSGGTEANNQALASVRGACLRGLGGRGPIGGSRPLASCGTPPRRLCSAGSTSSASPSAWPGVKPALVSVMLANNETGVVQPVAEVAELAHRQEDHERGHTT